MTPSATTFATCRGAAATAPSVLEVPGDAATAVKVRRRSGRPPPPSPAGLRTAV